MSYPASYNTWHKLKETDEVVMVSWTHRCYVMIIISKVVGLVLCSEGGRRVLFCGLIRHSALFCCLAVCMGGGIKDKYRAGFGVIKVQRSQLSLWVWLRF